MIELFANFSLLQSFALIGLITLTIPILIHLFNPSRGKLVLIGNINFIKKIKNVRVIEVKISQWILLLLRLLIFLVLTLILTNLVKNEPRTYTDRTHVFISPDWMNNAAAQEKDLLLQQHALDRVFLLDSDFIEYDLTSADLLSKINLTSNLEVSTNALLAELDSKKLIAENNILYVTDRMNQFSGGQTDNLYSERFDWRVINLALAVQSAALNIDVYYSPSRTVDYQYLKLAFETLAKASEIKLDVKYRLAEDFNSDQTISEMPDWIFWLNDKLAPLAIEQQVQAGSYLFSDLTDKLEIKPTATSIHVEHFWIKFYSKLPDVGSSNTSSNATPIWFNDKGEVALTSKSKGEGKVFQFNSRLNPDWSNLISTIQFPVILAELLNQSPTIVEQQQIAITSLNSADDKQIAINIGTDNQLTSYRAILLLILCLLWLVERVVAESQELSNEG